MKSLSCVRLFVTPWTAAHQVPQSMGLPRQEHWSGLLYPSPGDLPHPGTEPGSGKVVSREQDWGKETGHETSLAAWWLRCYTPSAGGIGSIPSWETESLNVAEHSLQKSGRRWGRRWPGQVDACVPESDGSSLVPKEAMASQGHLF